MIKCGSGLTAPPMRRGSLGVRLRLQARPGCTRRVQLPVALDQPLMLLQPIQLHVRGFQAVETNAAIH